MSLDAHFNFIKQYCCSQKRSRVVQCLSILLYMLLKFQTAIKSTQDIDLIQVYCIGSPRSKTAKFQ